MPWLVSGHPNFFLMLMHPEQRWADSVLEQLCEHAQMASELAATSFGPAQVQVTRTHAGRHPCVVLTLPRPTAPTEAFMIGLVQHGPPGEPEINHINLLNFTVELVDGDPPSAAFCEWEKDKTNHVNYGHGPVPSLDEFVAWMAKLVDSRPT
ncbi:hypothetical protein DB30_04441 [Enhygromyxa salina]|uniref:Uncharacterized protein n=1 Tax=Enhygromyxa salina TaxID=215803 RepID=A0A0C1ZZ75_9BACT|nr:hypothetical protein DB30_04441 [Enhygromyxa salina]